MTLITDTKLSEWKAIAEKATVGPWEVGDDDKLDGWPFVPIYNDDGVHVSDAQPVDDLIAGLGIGGETRANAALIAAAREALPALIEIAERLADTRRFAAMVDAQFMRRGFNAEKFARAIQDYCLGSDA